jgi:hypothetical protein
MSLGASNRFRRDCVVRCEACFSRVSLACGWTERLGTLEASETDNEINTTNNE